MNICICSKSIKLLLLHIQFKNLYMWSLEERHLKWMETFFSCLMFSLFLYLKIIWVIWRTKPDSKSSVDSNRRTKDVRNWTRHIIKMYKIYYYVIFSQLLQNMYFDPTTYGQQNYIAHGQSISLSFCWWSFFSRSLFVHLLASE